MFIKLDQTLINPYLFATIAKKIIGKISKPKHAICFEIDNEKEFIMEYETAEERDNKFDQIAELLCTRNPESKL